MPANHKNSVKSKNHLTLDKLTNNFLTLVLSINPLGLKMIERIKNVLQCPYNAFA